MECAPVNLGSGTTPEHPCVAAWGGVGPEICGWADYTRVRQVLVQEHNNLVDRIELWNARIGKTINGRFVDWSLRETAAWGTYEASSSLLDRRSKSFLGHTFLDLGGMEFGFFGPISEFALMAARVHAATCDMDQSLHELGLPLPAVPVEPPAPEGITEKFVSGMQNVAKGVGWLLVAGLLVGVGVIAITRSGGSGAAKP